MKRHEGNWLKALPLLIWKRPSYFVLEAIYLTVCPLFYPITYITFYWVFYLSISPFYPFSVPIFAESYLVSSHDLRYVHSHHKAVDSTLHYCRRTKRRAYFSTHSICNWSRTLRFPKDFCITFREASKAKGKMLHSQLF